MELSATCTNHVTLMTSGTKVKCGLNERSLRNGMERLLESLPNMTSTLTVIDTEQYRIALSTVHCCRARGFNGHFIAEVAPGVLESVFYSPQCVRLHASFSPLLDSRCQDQFETFISVSSPAPQNCGT
jgi:hypothetical protein